MKVIHREVLASTQDEAKRLAEAGSGPLLVRADRQTGGRGREGRRFSSGKGGVYFSLLLTKPALRPDQLADLSLRVGLELAKALAAISGVDTAVKPPNDVMALWEGEFRKVAGVLIEARGGAALDWLVIGVGINVTNRLPAGLKSATTLRRLSSRRLSLDAVLKEALSAVRSAL